MTVGAIQMYEQGGLAILKNDLDFESATIKVAIIKDAFTPNVVTDANMTSTLVEECDDAGYVRQTVATPSISVVSGKIRFDCDDITFGTNVTLTGKYLVFFLDTGVSGTSIPLFVTDLKTEGGSVSSVSSDFAYSINADGLYELTVNV